MENPEFLDRLSKITYDDINAGHIDKLLKYIKKETFQPKEVA